MNKFYVIHIQIMKDETQAQSIFAYATRDEAISTYHSNLASDYISQTLKSFSCMVVNYIGGVEAREYWEEVEEPTPDESEG